MLITSWALTCALALRPKVDHLDYDNGYSRYSKKQWDYFSPPDGYENAWRENERWLDGVSCLRVIAGVFSLPATIFVLWRTMQLFSERKTMGDETMRLGQLWKKGGASKKFVIGAGILCVIGIISLGCV